MDIYADNPISCEPPQDSLVCDINWGRLAAGVATGGLSEAAKYGYDQTYGKAADAQKSGYQQAGDASAKLGKEQRDWETQEGRNAMAFYGGNADGSQGGGDMAVGRGRYGVLDALKDEKNNRPGQQQDYFGYMKQQAGQLTNQEQLYNERKSGTDPAAAYMDQRGTEQINSQLAARGRFNSGPGVRQVSDYLANANAQRSQQLANLAGGADQSRLGVDTAYGGAATGASNEESKYFGDLTKGYQNADQSMADTYGHYSDLAGQAYSQGQVGKIQAQLAASGVDAETIKAMTDLFLKGGGEAIKATSSG